MATMDKKKSRKGEDVFSRGFDNMKKARDQQQSAFRPEFWLKDGESAKIIFLDKEPFNVHLHQYKVRGRTRKYTCLRKNCPLCKLDNPRFMAVFRIIDLRRFPEKDKKGKVIPGGKKSPYKEKYWETGTRVQSTVERLMGKKRLYKKLCEVSRDGEGTSSTYQFDTQGPLEDNLRERVEKMLTPQLDFEKDYACKDRDELKDLSVMFGGSDDDDDEDDDEPKGKKKSYLEDEDEDDEPKSKKKKRKSSDDDDDDDDDDDEDDDGDNKKKKKRKSSDDDDDDDDPPWKDGEDEDDD